MKGFLGLERSDRNNNGFKPVFRGKFHSGFGSIVVSSVRTHLNHIPVAAMRVRTRNIERMITETIEPLDEITGVFLDAE